MNNNIQSNEEEKKSFNFQMDKHGFYIDPYVRKLFQLSKTEFYFFLQKLLGCFIFRGKKGIAFKFYNKLLYEFKQKIKKNQYLYIELHKVFNKILPYFDASPRKIGRRSIQIIPSVAKGNRRFALMLKWIVRSQRNKTNVFGINIESICDYLFDVLSDRGSIIRLKNEFYRTTLANKHLLKQRRNIKYVRKQLEKKRQERENEYIYKSDDEFFDIYKLRNEEKKKFLLKKVLYKNI